MQKNGLKGEWNIMKITCNIIEDLLPSYIDQICSEDSCKLVEEHLKTCDECKRKLQEMKEPIKCPEVFPIEERSNPFMKIKKKNCMKIILAIIISVCVTSGVLFAIQEIGVLSDYFYPMDIAVVRNTSETNDWITVNFSNEEYLLFDSVFYDKEMINDANSDGDVLVRILDENNELIMDDVAIEAGTSVKLDELKKNRKYIVQVKCNKGTYFINFV